MRKENRMIRFFTILYVIFFVNGGAQLLLTKYRIITVVPTILLIAMQCRHILGVSIKNRELQYVLMRLATITLTLLVIVTSSDLSIKNRVIEVVVVIGTVAILYKKWSKAEIN